MFFGSLAFVFEVMLYVGLGLPLINLLVSAVGGGGEATGEFEVSGEAAAELGEVNFEAGDAAPESGGEGFLAFDVYCLCLALVVTGACGMFSVSNFAAAALLLAIICSTLAGIGAYGLLYRLVIRPLKRNDAEALKQRSLSFRHARVSFRVEHDSPGQIQTTDAGGAVISYRAQLDPQICTLSRIEEGEEVIITEIREADGLCYVTLAQRKILS